ncbi:methionine/alanine import family NSS transporter small subunit [Leucobacter sp. CSA1]|uniref:Methionine/alanine import family NSS transporter small subunit n=1 Tax=Leucobacter chromiisoli TaxID=2796471 RepID=A0A934UUB3_9MICO|nr:methionine/alanine import family NSS transporter small subunit [Leucobacter chromiisoli]MBK0419299.1 methionine/alanine import family NSS transporter small subunit [Leucobacter chromiisoli]
MTPVAVVFMILSFVLLWGGLIASSIFLARRPEVPVYPPGGDDPEGEEVYDLPPMRDT